TRSALRARAIRLGLAWIWCGSCSALVATETSTSLPPSSWTSAPHSGSQAKTRSAACAGHASSTSGAAKRARRVLRCIMSCSCSAKPSVAVRAVRAQAHLVLQEKLVVADAFARAILRELQAHARELAGIEVDHQRVLVRPEAVGDEHARVGTVVRRAGIEPLGAQPRTPARRELVDALQGP